MATAISANKAELIAIANSVASEKMIDKAIVIEAMEEAIQKSARNRYGAENDIRAKLDPDTGDLRLWRVVEVVETVEDYFKQVDLKQGQKLQPGAALGDRAQIPGYGRTHRTARRRVSSRSYRCCHPGRSFETGQGRRRHRGQRYAAQHG